MSKFKVGDRVGYFVPYPTGLQMRTGSVVWISAHGKWLELTAGGIFVYDYRDVFHFPSDTIPEGYRLVHVPSTAPLPPEPAREICNGIGCEGCHECYPTRRQHDLEPEPLHWSELPPATEVTWSQIPVGREFRWYVGSKASFYKLSDDTYRLSDGAVVHRLSDRPIDKLIRKSALLVLLPDDPEICHCAGCKGQCTGFDTQFECTEVTS